MATVLGTWSAYRGAEHGYVFDTAQKAVASGSARAARTREQLSTPLVEQSVCDNVFADDGEVFVRSTLLESWLRALERAIATLGATRWTLRHVGWNPRASKLRCEVPVKASLVKVHWLTTGELLLHCGFRHRVSKARNYLYIYIYCRSLF